MLGLTDAASNTVVWGRAPHTAEPPAGLLNQYQILTSISKIIYNTEVDINPSGNFLPMSVFHLNLLSC